MKRSSFIKAVALCGIAAIALTTSAQAQVTKDDAKCRATANKSAGKYASTANKAIVGCVKDRLKGKNAINNCTNPDTADTKGKLPGARAKLIDAVGGVKDKCKGILPPSYLTCPSPASNQGPIGGTGDVGTCLANLVAETDGSGQVEQVWSYILNADLSSPDLAGKAEGKCVNSVAKNAAKLYDTYIKTVGKVVQGSDKGGGSYDVSTSPTSDDKSKVSKAQGKLAAAIQKDCIDSGVSQATITALGSCSQTASELAGCIGTAMVRNAAGINSLSFEMGGSCPANVRVLGDGTFVDGNRSASLLSSGYAGVGHGAELPDGFIGGVNLTCSDGTCSDCSVSASCSEGNCRCANAPSTECDEPFGVDVDDCGAGNECNLYFGAPLPLSAAGVPSCVVTRIAQDLTGTADLGTGESETTVSSIARVYTSGSAIDQSDPCPRCQGDGTPNDGVKGGTCEQGANPGAACDVNFTDPVFGDTSYDCQPDGGFAPINLDITLSAGDKSSSFDLPSNLGGGLMVPCLVCSGNSALACDDDQVCIDAGAGSCNSSGAGGASQLPNSCSDFDCGVDGLCTNPASDVKFCDGFLKQGGTGILTCTTNGDCTAYDPAVESGDAGNCTLSEARKCYPDPKVTDIGSSGQDGAVLTSHFCTPPSDPAVNLAAGIPGLSVLSIEFDFTPRCADGTTLTQLGANNCP